MRKIFVLAAVAALTAQAKPVDENVVYDSTKVEQLQEVVVKGVRAQKNAPFATTNIRKKGAGRILDNR